MTPAERVAEWNNGYNDIIGKIANCASVDARSELLKEHQEELIKFKESNIAVDNHLKYLCVTIEGEILLNKNGQLLTGTEAWNYSYDKLIRDISMCKSMDARRELEHQEELVKYRDSKLPVDNDLNYLNIALGSDGKVSTLPSNDNANSTDKSYQNMIIGAGHVPIGKQVYRWR